MRETGRPYISSEELTTGLLDVISLALSATDGRMD
jgi:hypothetical protein